MIGLSAAFLVALPVSCIFYGLALATFILCVKCLVTPAQSLTGMRWCFLAFSSTMFVVATISIGQAMRHNLNAFVYYTGPGGAFAELNDPKDPMNLVHTITYPIQAFLGDSILVYRTWVVNRRDWRFIVLPILLLFGDLLTASGLAYSEHHLVHGEYSDPTVAPWAAAFAGVTLALNLICTGLITFRILSVRREISCIETSTSRSLYKTLIRVVVESGLIYTTTSLAFVITVVTGGAEMYIVADSYLQIVPICFNLMIIRTHSGRGEDQQWVGNVTSPIQFKTYESRDAISRGRQDFDVESVLPRYPETLWVEGRTKDVSGA